jgi:transcriptional regulator with XRE-family HTH domain
LPVRRGRFTRQEVHEIREARERGVSLNALARRYGVTRQAISQIARGRVYRNVR